MESYVLINLEGEGEEEIKNRNLKIMLLYMQGKFKLEDGDFRILIFISNF